MLKVLPDSRGCIKKVLFHHAPVRLKGRLIQEGIFKNFLEGLNQTGVKPEVFVFATYVSEAEKKTLDLEANDWKNLAEHLEYVNVQIDSAERPTAPYAQDTCVVLDTGQPAFIMSGSSRFKEQPKVMVEAEKLLIKAKLRPKRLTTKYNLEGGYVYATSNHLFYSNPLDRQVVRQFTQDAIFVQSLISRIVEQILSVLAPGILPYAIPVHVDLMLSVLERNDSLDVFYVDFRETMLASPFLSRNHRILLRRRFDEWDQNMEKLLDRIKSRLKNVQLHKVPGLIDFGGISPGVHSAANLLFHSTKNKDYAFYLKYPREIEEQNNIQINKQIEDVLRGADVSLIPVAGANEITNLNHVFNSAGLRCLVKVLSRT
jgi:hypothetical protein